MHGMSEMGREDIEAVLEVRREQGPALEPALVDAMAHRIEATVRRRMEAEVAERKRAETAARQGQGSRVAVAIVSLVLSLPLSAIALANSGLLGLTVVWVGIVLVNVAMAIRRPPAK